MTWRPRKSAASGMRPPGPIPLRQSSVTGRAGGPASGRGSAATGAHPSQSSLLRQRACKAIPDLLATISVLQERRAGRSYRSADFRTLARWFAQAPSEDDAHRLWRAAFGLSPSRHFSGEPPEGADTGESWLDAPSQVISARLRSTGHYERPVTCADVPAAGHLQPAHRGSYAGTFGPPTERTIARTGTALVSAVLVSPGWGCVVRGFCRRHATCV